jgi:hypothetical protein
MHELTDIYDLLRSHNLCANQTEFSRDWLGRSDGYFAYLRSSHAEASSSSLGMLSARISNVLFRTPGQIDEADRKCLLKAAVAAGLMMFRERSREVNGARRQRRESVADDPN